VRKQSHSRKIANRGDFSGRDFLDGKGYGWKVFSEMVQSIRESQENNNCNFAISQILLVAEVCIDRHQHIKSRFRESQQFAVLFSKPTRFLDCARLVAHDR